MPSALADQGKAPYAGLPLAGRAYVPPLASDQPRFVRHSRRHLYGLCAQAAPQHCAPASSTVPATPFAARGRIWRGTASELQAILTGPSAPNRRQAEELLCWPKATGTYLGRLADRSDLYATEYQLLVRKGPHQKGVQTYTITETDAPADWRLPL